MNTKTTVSLSEARKNIFDIVNQVQAPNRVFTLTLDGKPKVVMVSAEEYESLIETIEALHHFPDLDARILETNEALKTGAYKSWKSWDTEKSTVTKIPRAKKYVPTLPSSKSRKKSS